MFATFVDRPILAAVISVIITTLGIEDYVVGETPDCAAEPSLPLRRWVTRVIREFGNEVATPAEAREILGLSK